MNDSVGRWKRDPVAFIEEVLRNPETRKPFELYEAQQRFLQAALTPTADGRLPHPELLFSAPKKSGKTATAAMATLYTILCLGGPYAEGYCVANDFEQAQSRVFQAITRIIKASALKSSAKITANRIEFPSTGASITALASDYAGAAGANPTITIFDELWGYTSERARRLWDEMVPVPTRKVSVRLTTTYAGFEGESELLESLYQRGLQGEPIAPDLYRSDGMLMYWTHDPIAPGRRPHGSTRCASSCARMPTCGRSRTGSFRPKGPSSPSNGGIVASIAAHARYCSSSAGRSGSASTPRSSVTRRRLSRVLGRRNQSASGSSGTGFFSQGPTIRLISRPRLNGPCSNSAGVIRSARFSTIRISSWPSPNA